mgnify:CR=1 FL=1
MSGRSPSTAGVPPLRARDNRAFAPIATVLALLATLVTVLMASASPATADGSGAVPGTPRGAMSAIAVGEGHACAIVQGGDVYCWGRNDQGQLGQGSTTDVGTAPGQVAGLSPVPLGGRAIAVGAGDRFSCALLEGGDVKCWGYELSGRLGLADGSTGTGNTGGSPGEVASLGPIDLGTNVRATAIALGESVVAKSEAGSSLQLQAKVRLAAWLGAIGKQSAARQRLLEVEDAGKRTTLTEASAKLWYADALRQLGGRDRLYNASALLIEVTKEDPLQARAYVVRGGLLYSVYREDSRFPSAESEYKRALERCGEYAYAR